MPPGICPALKYEAKLLFNRASRSRGFSSPSASAMDWNISSRRPADLSFTSSGESPPIAERLSQSQPIISRRDSPLQASFTSTMTGCPLLSMRTISANPFSNGNSRLTVTSAVSSRSTRSTGCPARISCSSYSFLKGSGC